MKKSWIPLLLLLAIPLVSGELVQLPLNFIHAEIVGDTAIRFQSEINANDQNITNVDFLCLDYPNGTEGDCRDMWNSTITIQNTTVNQTINNTIIINNTLNVNISQGDGIVLTPNPIVQNGSVAVNMTYITEQLVLSLVPTGTVSAYAGTTAPSGYLMANGSIVLKSTYSNLCVVLGSTYGVNNATHCQLPNMTQRFALGKSTSGTGSTLGGIGGQIDHTHTVTTGSVSVGILGVLTSAAPAGQVITSTSNNPPFLVLNYIIKT